MKQIFYTAIIIFVLSSCSDNSKDKIPKKENLVEISNGRYSEWYPGKKQLKFQGNLDSLGKRDGRWDFFSDKGTVLSTTEFSHGKKQGFSIVKYPNGQIHYRGEYSNDEQVGVWTTYDIKGNVVQEKTYDLPQ
jgi:antitoxin component YwqK of YwqJK toxin-antitoxin module